MPSAPPSVLACAPACASACVMAIVPPMSSATRAQKRFIASLLSFRARSGFSPGNGNGRSSQRLERGAQLGREELRLLPSREVAALVDLVEVGHVAIGAPGPGFRRTVAVLPKIP